MNSVENKASRLGRLSRCWGKTDEATGKFHPALYHMLDVGYVAQELLSSQAPPRWRLMLGRVFGVEPETLIEWIPWIAALRDIGKISADFQSQNESQKARSLPHTRGGEPFTVVKYQFTKET